MRLSSYDRWLTEQHEPADPPEGWVDPGPDDRVPVRERRVAPRRAEETAYHYARELLIAVAQLVTEERRAGIPADAQPLVKLDEAVDIYREAERLLAARAPRRIMPGARR